METCDISLVKQEIVELIKTEPQNEDEFNMYGQSGIKTEDESDTSNFVDEIVKTEIKLYESALGIMNSSIDHLTPLDKSEMPTALPASFVPCCLTVVLLLLWLISCNMDHFDTEKFIVGIHNRPSLWNSSSDDYYYHELKKKCWEEVVDIFGEDLITIVEKNELGKIQAMSIHSSTSMLRLWPQLVYWLSYWLAPWLASWLADPTNANSAALPSWCDTALRPFLDGRNIN
uniref:MADF domain-containing protein n=1 Tax=Timema douglasi TaxID=61478 RepID=A0A7R8ZDH2_TIMDO|nr:unnamed protein product [Timema douglasi]